MHLLNIGITHWFVGICQDLLLDLRAEQDGRVSISAADEQSPDKVSGKAASLARRPSVVNSCSKRRQLGYGQTNAGTPGSARYGHDKKTTREYRRQSPLRAAQT